LKIKDNCIQTQPKKMALEFIETNKMYGGIASDGHGGISMELYHECHDRGCF
jgi:hypothetical protein